MGWYLVGLSFVFKFFFFFFGGGGSGVVTWWGTGENAFGGILHGHTCDIVPPFVFCPDV